MKRGDPTKLLDKFGIDRYCEHVIAGDSMKVVAALAGVSVASLWRWLRADGVRAARAAEARQFAAEAYCDRAEEAIVRARSVFALSKARELGHHLRWKAACVAPRDFGKKVGIEATGAGGTPLVPAPKTHEEIVDAARRILYTLSQAGRINAKARPPKPVAPGPKAWE